MYNLFDQQKGTSSAVRCVSGETCARVEAGRQAVLLTTFGAQRLGFSLQSLKVPFFRYLRAVIRVVRGAWGLGESIVTEFAR